MSHMTFKLGHFKNGLGQAMTLKLWKTDIIQTNMISINFHSFYALHSFDLCIAVNGQVIVELKHYFEKWQSILNKGTPGAKCTCTRVVWNDSNFTCSFQAREHIFFKFTFTIHCCSGSTYIWGNLFFSFFFSFLLFFYFLFSHQYDPMIISFCVRIEYSVWMMQKRSLDWTLTVYVCRHKNVFFGPDSDSF